MLNAAMRRFGAAVQVRVAEEGVTMKEASMQDGTNAVGYVAQAGAGDVKEAYYDKREEEWLAALRTGPRKPPRSDDAEVTHELVGRLLMELRVQREHNETLGTALAQAVEDRARLRKNLTSAHQRERKLEGDIKVMTESAAFNMALFHEAEDALTRLGYYVSRTGSTGEPRRDKHGRLIVAKRRGSR